MESEKAKKIIITVLGIAILAVILSIIIFLVNEMQEAKIQNESILAKIEEIKINTIEIEENNNNNNNIVETSMSNIKVSPNALINKKIMYSNCGHILTQLDNVDISLVNLTEDEIKEIFYDWEIEEFSEDKICLFQEVDGICNEHYVLKEYNSHIGIYNKDVDGNLNFIEETQISTFYLTYEDLEKLEVGIELTGKTALYEYLEDYD